MTKPEAKELWPALKAWTEGAVIQYRPPGADYPWQDITNEDIGTIDGYEWRVKPQPKLRAWKPEEVPVGALLRGGWGRAVLTHTNDSGDMMTFCAPDCENGRQWFVSQSHVIEGLEHSTDGGKTWRPCGVEESA